MYRGSFLGATQIQSQAGFEIGLEMVVKAYVGGYRIGEIPTTWRDRVAGTSRFNIRKWLPHYLRWYRYAFRRRAAAPNSRRPSLKKILCLGGAGFIGSYVVRELLNAGHSVTVIDNFSKYGYIEHDFYDHPKFRLEIKDVRTMYPMEFKGYDVVLCLAALIGGIRYFHKIPYRISRDNTELLAHAIDSTLAAAPEALFVYFSSSMIYERMDRPVTEADSLQQPVPITNYGMQKLFGEFMTRGAHQEFGLTYLIVRPFNAVGSGELPDIKSDGSVEFGMSHVIPDFIYKAIVKQTPFEIFGDGRQVRTFTHAKDISEALRAIIDKGLVNDDFEHLRTEYGERFRRSRQRFGRT